LNTIQMQPMDFYFQINAENVVYVGSKTDIGLVILVQEREIYANASRLN